MPRRLSALLLLSLPLFILHGQKINHDLGLWAGAGHQYMRDEFISPLVYQGNAAVVQFSHESRQAGIYHHLGMQYQRGRIHPIGINESSAALHRGNLSWNRAWTVDTAGLSSICLGFQLQGTFVATEHHQWSNNNYSHLLAFGAGPSILLSRSLCLLKICTQLTWELSVPLVTYLIRPSYGSIAPDGALDRGRRDRWILINGGRITSLHEYQRVSSHVSLSRPFLDRMKLRLGYQWDFQRCTVNNAYQAANHLLYLGMYYTL